MAGRHNVRKLLLIAGSILALLNIMLTATYFASRPNNAPLPAAKLTENEYAAAKAELLGLMSTGGVEASLIRIQDRIARQPSFASDCHPLLHELGHAAYKKYGNFQAAVRYQNGLCNSGYTHGVIEASFLAAPDAAVAILSTCPPADKQNFEQWQCYHGLGHGAMYATEKDLTRSLELCAKLTDQFNEKACVNGTFMEHFILKDHAGRTADATSDGLAVCQKQPEGNRDSCYFYAPTAFLEQQPGRYSEAFKWCAQAGVKYMDTCISGSGAQAMKDNITNPEFAAAICKLAKSGYRPACARGAIDLFINHHASSAAALPLCDREFAAYKSICRQAVKDKKDTFAI